MVERLLGLELGKDIDRCDFIEDIFLKERECRVCEDYDPVNDRCTRYDDLNNNEEED